MPTGCSMLGGQGGSQRATTRPSREVPRGDQKVKRPPKELVELQRQRYAAGLDIHTGRPLVDQELEDWKKEQEELREFARKFGPLALVPTS